MMKNIKNQLITVFIVCLVFTSFHVSAGGLFGDDENVIWKSGPNRFFKYIEQDESSFGKNDHPVELSEKEIGLAVEALRISDSSLFSKDKKTKAVFSLAQAKDIGEQLSKGLKNAKPNQDIIFALEKSVSQLIFLTDNVFVVGRAFYKDGKLNIIIGEYDFFRNEEFERVYDSSGQINVTYPFNYGRRARNSGRMKENLITADGIANKIIDKELREDWFVIDVDVAAKAYLAKKNEEENPPGRAVDDRAVRLEAARLAKERRELRVEMARMRKEFQEGSNGDASTIEERLARLDELRKKELITAEEYDQKRNDILNDI